MRIIKTTSIAAAAMAALLLATSVGSVGLASDKGKRCTKTSTSCYDTKTKKARTCVTETCTYADGHTTTSVSVELTTATGTTTKPPVDITTSAGAIGDIPGESTDKGHQN